MRRSLNNFCEFSGWVKIFLILMLTVFNMGSTFGQYIPMVNENKFWIYKNYYSNDKPNLTSGYLINFEGDTTIQNVPYNKVWHQELSGTHSCPPLQTPCFVFDQPYHIVDKFLIGFIREDINEKKVYYKPKTGTYCNEEEYVLFDFSLEQHDTLDDCKKAALGSQMDFGVIDSISYQLIYGEYRKIFHTFGFVTYIGLPYEGQVNIIEGVGFDRYGLFHGYNNLFELVDYCEGSLNDCNIISKSTELLDEAIVFYPNPTEDLMYVKGNFHLASAKIISYTGQETKVPNYGNTIELKGIPNGLYILEITTNEGKRLMGKVVKQ